MARADKVAAVADLATAFRESQAAVLTEYRGLSVAELAQLRAALGTTTTYSVVKNTLTKIAAREAGVDSLDALLVGPSAIAFVQGDPVEAAKGLRDFARTHPMLVIKGGVLDGAPLTAGELARLADLESREVLLAKLAGAMKASLSGAAALFQAPLAQAARTLEALRAKLAADQGTADASPDESDDSTAVSAADSAVDTGDLPSTPAEDTEPADASVEATDAGDLPSTPAEHTESVAASVDPTDEVRSDPADGAVDIGTDAADPGVAQTGDDTLPSADAVSDTSTSATTDE